MTSHRKRGQMSVWVILALVIVAGVLLYFVLRNRGGEQSIPAEIAPVFSQYESCMYDEALAALSLAGTQGGWVEVPEYIPGSEYAPWASQLNFLGFGLPYWWYISGNGVVKDQVPTQSDIEKGIKKYIEEQIATCDFQHFYDEGISLKLSSPTVTKVNINDDSVEITLRAPLTATKGSVTGQKDAYSLLVTSAFGKLYSQAKKIYTYEQQSLFLEQYGEDVLRLYAPVDGVELSCSPKVWKTREVISDLKSGLESNIATLKFKGDYYTLKDAKRSYFVVPLNVDVPVRVMYSQSWPTKVEIEGAENELMFAKPVGTQEGLGVMGFCYAPYHFIYTVAYPVVFQLMEGQEVFQFGVISVINKNLPRDAGFSSFIGENISEDICATANKDISVSLYDASLNPVDGEVSYSCFDQQCTLGESSGGKISGKVPTCLNGYLEVSAEGYALKKQGFSSNKESSAEVYLDKEYPIEVKMKLGGYLLRDEVALVTFEGTSSKSVMLPDADKANLAEGMYNLTVYVYSNASLTIPASTKTQCQEVPRSGLLGMFGSTKEQCFDITLPESKLEQVLVGGGTGSEYFLPDQLSKGRLTISVNTLQKPTSIEQLQQNFEAVAQENVGVDFS